MVQGDRMGPARVIAALRMLEPELRREGVRQMSLFGSVARGQAGADSDVDLAVAFDPAARMDLVRLTALEQRLGDVLGCPVELLALPIKNPRLRARIEQDFRDVF